MAKPLQFLAEAADEGHEAWQWYLKRSPRAAQRFQQEIDRAIDEIGKQPDRWPEYVHGTRYFPLRRFPYVVVFRETDAAVQIIAIAHSHRREGYWRRRTM